MTKRILGVGCRKKIRLPDFPTLVWVQLPGLTPTAVYTINIDQKSKIQKFTVFGEAGSDVEFWRGQHVEIRVKERAKPFLLSRIFESRPPQNETWRHSMPKSSGFFYLVQVVLTILFPVPEPRIAVFRVIKPSKKRHLQEVLERFQVPRGLPEVFGRHFSYMVAVTIGSFSGFGLPRQTFGSQTPLGSFCHPKKRVACSDSDFTRYFLGTKKRYLQELSKRCFLWRQNSCSKLVVTCCSLILIVIFCSILIFKSLKLVCAPFLN